MTSEVKAILERVNDTADYGYVDFTDINATNVFGDNALHCVIVWGDYEAAKTLIANGININQRGELGYTPLHTAYEFERSDIVALLLENGADASERIEDEKPVILERHRNHLEKLAEMNLELEKQIEKYCGKPRPE